MSGEPASKDTIQALIRDWGESYSSYYDEHARPEAKFKATPLRGKVRDPLTAGSAAELRNLIEADCAAEKAGFDRADALGKVITKQEDDDD